MAEVSSDVVEEGGDNVKDAETEDAEKEVDNAQNNEERGGEISS